VYVSEVPDVTRVTRVPRGKPTGLTWEEVPVGWQARTLGRTITEADMVNFITSIGLTEPAFVDHRVSIFADGERVIPGILTFALAEALVNQTGILRGTGQGFLGANIKFAAPVLIADTIEVDIEVVESRTTSSGRQVVTTRNRVFNQTDVMVLEYWPARFIVGQGGQQLT
jgi:acyl dehydratase